MDKNVVYKSRQEKILINELASSSFISVQQLYDIKEYYDEKVPYHNFLHALTVAAEVLEFSLEDFNIIEIKSLFIAALFHDAWHKWTGEDLDEFRSLDIAFNSILKFEEEYNYEWIDFWVVRKAIIGTVFKNRSTISNKYSKVMADLDVKLWMSFSDFLYYSDFWMWLEIGHSKPESEDFAITDWFSNVWYFKFLMWVNKNIFLTDFLQKKFLKRSLENIQRYIKLSKNEYKTRYEVPLEEMFNYWKTHDITAQEFKEKFFVDDL